MIIRSKAQFFWLWEAGCLGNRTNLWRNPADAIASGALNIGFREVGKAGGGKAAIVPAYLAYAVADEWIKEGRAFIMDDTAPNDRTTLCGEIARTYRGLESSIAIRPFRSMREAISAGLLLPRSGALTLALLERFMDPSSRDDLDALLDLYPDATVEFSCFDVDAGRLPNRNTIFWETRNY